MLQPAGSVSAFRVSMRPMQDATLFVPFIFPVKLNGITLFQVANSGGKIDVMCDQDRFAGRQFKDEFLVPAAFGIVRQQPGDDPLPRNLPAAFIF